MNRTQFYICAAIFLALTALRFTSPALADRVSDGISRAINMEQEQTETVIELGKSLADGDVLETFLERFEKNFQAEPVSAPRRRPICSIMASSQLFAAADAVGKHVAGYAAFSPR